ncbi:MAG: hypothetical protein ABI016_16945 [Chthoniobacterales bacterium]
MKSPRSLCIRLLLATCPLTAAWAAPLGSEKDQPYLVIAETTSPNGEYAVAWALPKGPQIAWEEFRRGLRSSDYLPDFTNAEIADHLIELQSGRTLASVASGYWALPAGDTGAGHKSHPDDEWLEVAWSPQSDFVVVLRRLRDGPKWGSLRAVQIEGGVVAGQVENGNDLEAAAHAHLKKVYPKDYERAKDHLNLRFSDLESLGGARFSLNAVASLTNQDGNRTDKGSTIKLELRTDKKGKLSLHILGFSELDLDEAS